MGIADLRDQLSLFFKRLFYTDNFSTWILHGHPRSKTLHEIRDSGIKCVLLTDTKFFFFFTYYVILLCWKFLKINARNFVLSKFLRFKIVGDFTAQKNVLIFLNSFWKPQTTKWLFYKKKNLEDILNGLECRGVTSLLDTPIYKTTNCHSSTLALHV